MDNPRYAVYGKIGEGTFAKIYKAFDNSQGCLVALKSFITKSGIIPSAAIRELQFNSHIQHPHILSLKDYYQSKTDVILVYDYMETDLYKFIKRLKTPLNEAQLKCLFRMIISSVHHCHKNGILHRDIKTSNYLLSQDYIVKLGDMGLSTVIAKREELTLDVGTRWYKAPEILLGYKKYSFPADVWSIGCVLAEVASLNPIFKGINDLQQLSLISKFCGDINTAAFPVWLIIGRNG